MGEKMEAARKYRSENAQKWAEDKRPLTAEVIAEMRRDNEILSELGKAAWNEYIQEKKK